MSTVVRTRLLLTGSSLNMHPAPNKPILRAASFGLLVCFLLTSLAGCTVIFAKPGGTLGSVQHTTRFEAQIDLAQDVVDVPPRRAVALVDRATHLAKQTVPKKSGENALREYGVKHQPDNGPYVVQVGAYRSEERARSTWSSLESRTPSLFRDVVILIERADGRSSGAIYRVRAGYFSDAKEAGAFCVLLDLADYECMVVLAQPLDHPPPESTP